MDTRFKKGDNVLISPEVTHKKEWRKGTIIEIEKKPYVGIVLIVETNDGNIFFERECLFKSTEKELCLQ